MKQEDIEILLAKKLRIDELMANILAISSSASGKSDEEIKAALEEVKSLINESGLIDQ